MAGVKRNNDDLNNDERNDNSKNSNDNDNDNRTDNNNTNNNNNSNNSNNNNNNNNAGATDALAFNAAVCLGRFGVGSEEAEAKLRQAVDRGNKHMKARAMEILVRQMNIKDQQMVNAILDQVCARK